MKNPWMSFWLSAANQAANTARGFWVAEFRRQQRAMAKAAAQAASPEPSGGNKRPARKRRER